MAKTSMRIYTLEEIIDKQIGKRGTPERDKFEHEIIMWRMGQMIKQARKECNLSKGKLAKLIDVQKAQISKLEKGADTATIETTLKALKALKAEINFDIKIDGKYWQLQ